MNTSPATLSALKPNNEFFIGIDSDGCAFDTMEIKHKECFCPSFINHFNLQSVSKYARESWEFVNLYSRTRGTNRFSGLIYALDLLAKRDEAIMRKIKIPEINGIRNWVAVETKLGNPSLKKATDKTMDPGLSTLYDWSLDVNETIAKIVRNVPPFPYVRESLSKINKHADVIVISSANQESLNREWSEHGLEQYVRYIAGQETGSKKDCFEQAVKNKYSPEKTLMIGDAPGDLTAAKANNALFFPIIPGKEEKSWEIFYKEGLDRFFNGTFEGEYEDSLIDGFFTHLPEIPPWQRD